MTYNTHVTPTKTAYNTLHNNIIITTEEKKNLFDNLSRNAW